MEIDSELEQLRNELGAIEQEFSRRVKKLETSITSLEQSRSSRVQENKVQVNATKTVATPVDPNYAGSIDQWSPAKEKHKEALSEFSLTPHDKAVPAPSKPQPSTNTFEKRPESVEKSHKEAAGLSLVSTLLTFFGPFSGLLEKFFKVYLHYQKQGKAPVFFMTVAGIIALVFGFTYLLQYSFNEYLGEAGKVTIGFVVALLVTAGGIRFTNKRKDMAEYGSSLIALGVVLNYLCAYFAGPYYSLLPDLITFIFFVAITAGAYFLALLFETKIVATVTLVGGAFMPLVTGYGESSPGLYLSYLWVLAAVVLHLSQRIKWHELGIATVIISLGMVEFSISGSSTVSYEAFGLVAIIHGFFYLFAHYALRGLDANQGLSSQRLMIATANLVFFIYICQQLIADSQLLGILYLVNTLPWLLCFIKPSRFFHYLVGSKEYSAIQSFCILHAGLIAGVGILSLTSFEMTGILWCVEGLALMYLGGLFKFDKVRLEGYIAVAISLVIMGSQVLFWVANSFEMMTISIGPGWFNLISMTALIAVAIRLLKRQASTLPVREHALIPPLDTLFSVMSALSFLLTVGIVSVQMMWLSAIVPMFYLIWRAQKGKSLFTELLGLSCYLLFLVPILASASAVGNFHFSEQTIYAQIARVEAFLCLWLIAEFYKRYCNVSPNAKFAEGLRHLFYSLVPLLFLRSIFRNHNELFPLALWLSSSIALLLLIRLRYTILKIELWILVLVSSVVSMLGISTLVAGTIFYLVIGWLAQAQQRVILEPENLAYRHKVLKPLFSVGVYYFAIVIFIMMYLFTSQPALSLLATLLYFTALFFIKPILAPVRSSLRTIYTLIFGLAALLTYVHAHAVMVSSASLAVGAYNAVALLCTGFLVYSAQAQNRAVWTITGRQEVNIWLFHIMLIVAYTALLAQLFSTMLGPAISFALVVHAVIILFQTVKPRLGRLIWLSGTLFTIAALKILLWDMQGFSLVQKIVVFMLVGLCMLGAAFKFQKLVAAKSNKN